MDVSRDEKIVSYISMSLLTEYITHRNRRLYLCNSFKNISLQQGQEKFTYLIIYLQILQLNT